MGEIIFEYFDKVDNLCNFNDKEVDCNKVQLTLLSSKNEITSSQIKELAEGSKINNEEGLLSVVDTITVDNSKVQLLYVYLKAAINLKYDNVIKVFNSTLLASSSKSVFNTLARNEIYLKNCNVTCTENSCCLFLNENSCCCCENCTFSSCCSMVIDDNSKITFKNCKFLDISNNCINVKNRSIATFVDCEFSNCCCNDKKEKIILCNKESCIDMTNCKFSNVDSSIVIFNKSKVVSKDSTFSNFHNSSIIIKDESLIELSGCNFNCIDGNAILMINSTGVIVNCIFSSCNYPSMTIRGILSNPVIKNCQFLKNSSSSYLAIRNLSRPLVDGCTFDNFNYYCIHCSDLSNSVIKNSTFLNKLSGSTILVCDYSRILSDDLSIVDTKNSGEVFDTLIKLENYGSLVMKDNLQNIGISSSCNQLHKNIFSNNDLSCFSELFANSLRLLDVAKLVVVNNASNSSEYFNKNIGSKVNNSLSFINIPCGHCCNKSSSREYCEICEMKVGCRIQLCDKEGTCCCCKSRSVATFNVPCGHQCFCTVCSLQFLSKFKKCPICSKLITQVRIYLQ